MFGIVLSFDNNNSSILALGRIESRVNAMFPELTGAQTIAFNFKGAIFSSERTKLLSVGLFIRLSSKMFRPRMKARVSIKVRTLWFCEIRCSCVQAALMSRRMRSVAAFLIFNESIDPSGSSLEVITSSSKPCFSYHFFFRFHSAL